MEVLEKLAPDEMGLMCVVLSSLSWNSRRELSATLGRRGKPERGKLPGAKEHARIEIG